MNILLGIDFGTCNSSAALVIENHLRVVKEPLKQGYSFASSVYLTEQEEIIVGQAAENNRLRDLRRYRQQFKRELGISQPYPLGDRFFLPQELITEILRKLKSEAEKMAAALGKTSVNDAVITIPATYQQYKRQLMERAAQTAGFTSVKLLVEPVAAATYYAHHNQAQFKEGETILVYDLGGGTFDATLITKKGSGYQIITEPMGLEHCGGTDFDRAIYQDLKNRCSPALRKQLEDREAWRTRISISEYCIDLKHQLSETEEATVCIPIGTEIEQYRLTRTVFNQMIASSVKETIIICDRLIQNAGIDWQAVDRVLMVGGSCRIPYIQEVVEKKLGHSPLLVDEPELAVCQGGAIYGTNFAKTSSLVNSKPNSTKLLNGRYAFQKQLGRGGQGKTYLASDCKLSGNPLCAIKQLQPVNDAKLWETAKRLFLQEIAVLGKVGNHPQIPRLLDHFIENQKFYLVQEYVEGHSLSLELLPGERWSEERVIELLKEVLELLTFVHENNVIHRDIKPDNLIRRKIDNKLVLVDFGAVKQVRASRITTNSGKIISTSSIGTMGYMPPEQQRGQASPSTDLYALGMIGISALTGISALELQLEHSDSSTEELNWQQFASVDSKLAQILTRMVSYLPKDRYQTTKEVFEEIDSFGRLTTTVEERLKLINRPQLSERYSADDRVGNTSGLRSLHLRSQQNLVIFFDWQCTKTLTSHLASVSDLTFSSDGKNLASAGDDGTIKLWHLDNWELVHEFTRKSGFWKRDTTYFTSVAISSDGLAIAGGCLDKTIKLWHLKNGDLIREFKGHTDSVYATVISPDNQFLISSSREKTIKVWNLYTGKVIHNLVGHSDSVYSLALDPEGKILISGGRDNTIKVWNLASGKLINTLNGHLDWVRCLAINPKQRNFVSGSNDNKIELWDLDTGKLLRTFQGHENWVTSVAISPDGNTLISGSRDQTIKLWRLDSGQEIATLKDHSESICAVAIAPDGSTIASSSKDGVIKIWQLN
ncbi:Serine/threonine protein kinase-related protein [Stanieria cyanosphaera PCC 7437]|uniref:Serine/threonine protein kinase-related protein n=1 Tax=Stanieria cyanosphaera (strain ATCC 29371 / PCC 7437) TaxID=111780 RepID=K9Y0V1_STAC7|nr:Hsp70 family protein [Stanieria cyanosphaera]AFZ37944.1 Serine/threonine protein kinase-related protein [Stanieria cyanosphaera PCC 7437]